MNPRKKDLVKALKTIANWFEQQAEESAGDPGYWDHVIRAGALDEAADVLESYNKILWHLLAEKSGAYFVCGESGDKDTMGLPEKIFVCPSHGLEGMAVYTKTQDYSAPEW